MGVRSLAGPVLCLAAAPGVAMSEPAAALRLIWSAAPDVREAYAPPARSAGLTPPEAAPPRLQLRYRFNERMDVTVGKAGQQTQRTGFAPNGGGMRVGLNLRW